jgi:hypothetical protein
VDGRDDDLRDRIEAAAAAAQRRSGRPPSGEERLLLAVAAVELVTGFRRSWTGVAEVAAETG